MNAYDILIKPVLSEKSYKGIPGKRYTFIVAKSANKIEIRKAVEQIFSVKVESVHTMNYRGKLKRQGQHQGMTPSFKKAIIQLTADSKTIAEFDSLA
ncbi:MAG: 50S ribosomal protein L23 [Clostridiales bacterium]|jgi:large subunit ribosomal protein L23|nr:50S ribosomal protein L23 [Clostridiales bacterium]